MAAILNYKDIADKVYIDGLKPDYLEACRLDSNHSAGTLFYSLLMEAMKQSKFYKTFTIDTKAAFMLSLAGKDSDHPDYEYYKALTAEAIKPSAIGKIYKPIFEKTKIYCDGKINRPIKKVIPFKKPDKDKKLFEICSLSKDDYNKLMLLLKKKYNETGHPFISGEDNPRWIKYPSHGWQTYLAAFIEFCNSKGFISLNDFSDACIISICCNTFNIDKITNKKAFSDARVNAIDRIYLKPFFDFPPVI